MTEPSNAALYAELQEVRRDIAELQSEVASLRESAPTERMLSVEERIRRHHELFAEFCELAAQWQAETGGASMMTRIITHPAYLRIIGMGEQALPWILFELEEHGGHWYVALHAITGVNPVAHEDRGRRAKMREAWLGWGRDNGWIT